MPERGEGLKGRVDCYLWCSEKTQTLLNATPASACEFLVASLAIIRADPTLVSLEVGAVVSGLGLFCRLFAAGFAAGGAEGYGLPFVVVRHPGPLGAGLIFGGLCLASRDLAAFIAAFLLLPMTYWLQAAATDQRLAAAKGPQFSAYREGVDAAFPQLLPAWRFYSKRPFSLRLALNRERRKELWAAALTLLAFGTLAALFWTEQRPTFQQLALGVLGLYLVARFVYYGRRPSAGAKSKLR